MYFLHELFGFVSGIFLNNFLPQQEKESWKELVLPTACFLGALLPDTPVIYQISENIIKGRALGCCLSENFRLGTEALHNLWLWLGLLLLFSILIHRTKPALPAFHFGRALAFGGLICHVLVDALTHGRELSLLRNNYFWPVDFEWSGILGVWNYRTSTGLFDHKPLEVFLDILLGLFIAIFVLQKCLNYRQNNENIAFLPRTE